MTSRSLLWQGLPLTISKSQKRMTCARQSLSSTQNHCSNWNRSNRQACSLQCSTLTQTYQASPADREVVPRGFQIRLRAQRSSCCQAILCSQCTALSILKQRDWSKPPMTRRLEGRSLWGTLTCIPTRSPRLSQRVKKWRERGQTGARQFKTAGALSLKVWRFR